MFGSLVVCLPSQFSGGALVTRHNGQEITYDWSSPADDPVCSIQGAAFFSDVEHEILPVTEGYRVTLTYNLYHSTALSVLPAVPGCHNVTFPQQLGGSTEGSTFSVRGRGLGLFLPACLCV